MVMVGFPLRARHVLAKCSDPVLLAIMPIFAALAFPELDTGALYTSIAFLHLEHLLQPCTDRARPGMDLARAA